MDKQIWIDNKNLKILNLLINIFIKVTNITIGFKKFQK